MRANARRPATFSLRALYGALVVFGAIVAHLLAEAFGMGADSGSVTFSARHIYLGLAAAIALAVALRQIVSLFSASANGRDAKRLAELGLASLPFSSGRRMMLLTAALQFVLGWSSEIGEGCPLCGHDVTAGIVGAIAGALFMAMAMRLLARRLPSIAVAVARFLERFKAASPTRVYRDARLEWLFHDLLRFARLFNRPPPLRSSFVRSH